MIYDVKDFAAEVVNKSFQVPVLVDFWAEWCAPCRLLGPILEKLASQSGDRWVLAKVNTEELQDVAKVYRVSSIPNVKLFVDGNVVSEFLGALPEYQIVQWLQKVLPGKHRQQIEKAKTLLSENKLVDAEVLLQDIFKAEPDNQEVRILLAKTIVFVEPHKASELVKDVSDSKYSELAETIHTISRLLQIQANSATLPESPTKGMYLSAVSDTALQNFNGAIEKFIRIIRNDRYYDDDGARKACIAIFKYLGEEHETTLKYRRDFSSALY
ncbi:MAG: tetratricopeptide repeat protein [Bacteroidota bacterium]|nr:tetratricopeptide repeat protein [Bacteroidota bacterium]